MQENDLFFIRHA